MLGRRVRVTAVVTAGMLLAAAMAPLPAEAKSRCPLPVFGPGRDYHPRVDPKRFSPRIDSAWFPLKAGRTFVYAGVKDGKQAIDLFVPTRRTLVVDGVRTRVVEDRLYLDGVLAERTSDYYAQDRCGNVWYFGEDTAELDIHGRVVSREGSFRAGRDGAEPGVFMTAHPKVGEKFRQEWSPGHAEDVFAVLERSAHVTVPFGSFRHALRTGETTALEPGVLDNKYYVKGVGEVAEVAVQGPAEALRLVEIIS